MSPRAITTTLGYQNSLGVVYGMCCCGVCSSSAGHRFAPYTDRYFVGAKTICFRHSISHIFVTSRIMPLQKDVRDNAQYQYSLACGSTFAFEYCINSILRS